MRKYFSLIQFVIVSFIIALFSTLLGGSDSAGQAGIFIGTCILLGCARIAYSIEKDK